MMICSKYHAILQIMAGTEIVSLAALTKQSIQFHENMLHMPWTTYFFIQFVYFVLNRAAVNVTSPEDRLHQTFSFFLSFLSS